MTRIYLFLLSPLLEGLFTLVFIDQDLRQPHEHLEGNEEAFVIWWQVMTILIFLARLDGMQEMGHLLLVDLAHPGIGA